MSDTVIGAMEITVVVFVGLVLLLVAAVVVVGRRNARWMRGRAELEARWRAFLTGDVPGPPPMPVTDRDRTAVLILFNELAQEPADPGPTPGRAVAAAAAAGRRARLDHVAAALLDGDDAGKVVAFHALAHLGGDAAAEAARAYLDHPGTELSRAAARCLLLTDPGALGPVLDRVRRRPDWGPTRVTAMLAAIDPHAVGGGLASAVGRSAATGDSDGTIRLLGFLSCGSPEAARDACHRVLAQVGDSAVLAAALRGLAEVVLMVLGLAAGVLSLYAQLVPLALVLILAVLMSLVSVLTDQLCYNIYGGRLTWPLFGALVLENLGYRQIVWLAGLAGMWAWFWRRPVRPGARTAPGAFVRAYRP